MKSSLPFNETDKIINNLDIKKVSCIDQSTRN